MFFYLGYQVEDGFFFFGLVRCGLFFSSANRRVFALPGLLWIDP